MNEALAIALCAPNPYAPLNIDTDREDVASLKRLRRAQILAAVRRRLILDGERITLRSLASECAVSHQTISNLGGSGAELVQTAIIDYVAALTSQAKLVVAPNRILAWLDINWRSWEQHSEYIAASTKIYYSRDGNLIKSMQRNGSRLMGIELRRLKSLGKMKPECDTNATASCIATLIPAMTYTCINGAFGLKDLRLRLAIGISGLLIAGAATAHATEIEAWLASIRETS